MMEAPMQRRSLLFSVPAFLASRAYGAGFEVSHTDAEWKTMLSDRQYKVLRQSWTEGPNTSPLTYEHRKGTFACAGCDLALFSSDAKFESHTGWPSFWQPLDPDRPGRPTQRSSLPPLRWASWPCLQRWASPDRFALLHERGGAEIYRCLNAKPKFLRKDLAGAALFPQTRPQARQGHGRQPLKPQLILRYSSRGMICRHHH
jgi:SelR domain